MSDLVAAETYFALQFHYGVPKARARNLLLAFLRSGVVKLDPSHFDHAFVSAGGPGAVDRLIVGRYTGMGCTTLTFDRKLGRVHGAIRIKP